jgi:Ca2+-binding RTX toxin-like protein
MATIPGGGGVIHGTPGDDLHVPDGHWIAFGADGGEHIAAGNGHDLILGGNGNDLIIGGNGDDEIFGGEGNNTLIGGHGRDLLVGGNGDDLIVGGTGNQTLIGGGGDDTLIAGRGNETMIGGSGKDTFVFSSGGGRDVVMDFHDGDILEVQRNINGLHVNSAGDLVSRVHSDVDGNAVIDFGHGDSVTLVGVKAEDIHHDPSGFIKIH